MNIMHMKYAAEVARCGSINKAAETLLMNQPNLSRAIKELETSLGVAIFVRSAKGMEVTPEGAIFLQYANKILSQVDEVENMFKGDSVEKKRFSISVPRASYIAEAFAEFSKSLKKEECAELYYKETNSERAIKNILESDYKLGIVRYAENFDRFYKDRLEEKGLGYELIAEFRYVLIMSRESPLAKRETISFDCLKNYIEIAHADPYVPSLPFAEVKKEELPDNIPRRIFVFERASQFEILSENKDAFMWVSPVSQKLLDRYGLVQRKSEVGSKLYRDLLIHRRDYKLSDLDSRFISELCKSKREVL